MTKAELIKKLEGYQDDHLIMIADYDGVPREIDMNLTLHEVSAIDGNSTIDCEEIVGRSVVLLWHRSKLDE